MNKILIRTLELKRITNNWPEIVNSIDTYTSNTDLAFDLLINKLQELGIKFLGSKSDGEVICNEFEVVDEYLFFLNTIKYGIDAKVL